MSQVQTHLLLNAFLLVGVVRLGDRGRLVADAVKTRRTVAIEDDTGSDRPPIFAQAPALILEVEFALDALLDSRDNRPLLIPRCIAVHASVYAIAEIRVVEHIGRDDAANLVLVVRLDPSRNEPERRAAVRIDGDFGNRYEGRGRRIEPPRQPFEMLRGRRRNRTLCGSLRRVIFRCGRPTYGRQ